MKKAVTGKKAAGARTLCVADFAAAMEAIAPTRLAQDWDNVGLLVGDAQAALRRVLLCIDLTPPVVREAIEKKVDLVMAYHPPIFKPIKHLRAGDVGAEALVFQCVRAGIAIYSTHTALDAAEGGTNDVLALLCGITTTEPLECVEDGRDEVKVVTFVPGEHVERVAEALFAAGAGRIGNYAKCSFRMDGRGTFFGDESTNPAVGKKGRLEFVDETRLEVVVPIRNLPAVNRALWSVHPYEEPAYDIFPLKARPMKGIGRIGALPRAIALGRLAANLKSVTDAQCMQMVGAEKQIVDRAIMVAGSAGSLPFRAGLSERTVVITGEMRHHDALAIARAGATAILLGHWASERPVLKPLSERLSKSIPRVDVRVSARDFDPFHVC